MKRSIATVNDVLSPCYFPHDILVLIGRALFKQLFGCQSGATRSEWATFVYYTCANRALYHRFAHRLVGLAEELMWCAVCSERQSCCAQNCLRATTDQCRMPLARQPLKQEPRALELCDVCAVQVCNECGAGHCGCAQKEYVQCGGCGDAYCVGCADDVDFCADGCGCCRTCCGCDAPEECIACHREQVTSGLLFECTACAAQPLCRRCITACRQCRDAVICCRCREEGAWICDACRDESSSSL